MDSVASLVKGALNDKIKTILFTFFKGVFPGGEVDVVGKVKTIIRMIKVTLLDVLFIAGGWTYGVHDV